MTAYKNMIFAVKSYGKSRLIYLNLILVLAIVMILFFQNYKKTISLDCAYGKNPIGIILLIQNHFPSCKHPLKAVMIFNELPDKQDIEMMGKIHKKYSHQVDIAAMFLKRFKVENTIGFPYHFFPDKKILCASGERQFKKNYFLLLHENRVNYIENPIMIQKRNSVGVRNEIN